jgi:hypothetical protein
MKRNVIVIIVLSAFLAFSCRSKNRMKIDVKVLSSEIILQEEERQNNMRLEIGQIKQTGSSNFMRMKEDRSVNKDSPPIILDLIAARNNVKNVKSSDLFTSIHYIKLQPLPDSAFYEIGAGFMVSDHFIYGYSLNGIAQYTLNGQFLKYICQNESYYTRYEGKVMTTREQASMFVGARSPKLFQGKLYYIYEDRPAKMAVYMEYEETSDLQVLNLARQFEENTGHIRGLGKPFMQLHGEENFFRIPDMNPLGNGLVGTADNRKIGGTNDFFTITSSSGDTISTFKDLDPISNYTKSVARGAESAFNYMIDGVLHVRQVYNDTIFQVVPPNRIMPKYVLDFGEFGIESSLIGVDPGYDLSEKLLPDKFLETKNHLFLTYTKDYACPNTAKKGTLKYSRVIYDKRKNIMIPVYIDEFPFIPKVNAWPTAPNINLENDLDDTPFVWPVMTTSSGIPFTWFSGKQQDDRMQNTTFGNLTLEVNDYVIAIYK